MTDPARRQRVDLHVHSKHSGIMRPAVLEQLQVRESYTEPETVYERMGERGMSMVTITDHDSIDGCLELLHHGDRVFISEEVSAHFPGTGCVVHVLAYGISEAQHEEMHRLRFNVFELVDYLRTQDIVHSWAHPFSAVTYRMTPDVLRQSFLLFDTIELINGQKDPGHERLLRHVAEQLDRPRLEQWADRYDLEPADLDGRWGLTAGSDDHSGITLGRAYVEFDGPPTVAALLAAIRERRTRPHGHEMTGTNYAHTAYAGTLGFMKESHPSGSDQSLGRVFQLARDRRMPAEEELDPLLGRLLPAAMGTLMGAGTLPSPNRIIDEGHRAEVHDELYGLLNQTLLAAFRASFDEIRTAAAKLDLDTAIDEIPTLIRLWLFNVPYYFGLNYFNRERRRARWMYSWLGLDDSILPEARVAIFGDTLEEPSGFSIGLRRTIARLRDEGRTIWLCGPETRPEEARVDEDGLVRFAAHVAFPLPGYTRMQLGLPSLLEVTRWLDLEEIDLVQISTPGPAGWIAYLASRLLGIPAIGQFHTDVPAFAERLIGDATVTRMVARFVGAFYGGLDVVLAPTHAAADTVAALGVPAAKLRVVERGVDAAAFSPKHCDPEFWVRRGLEGRNTLLYVGRVSVEKNLPFLARTLRAMQQARVDFEFAAVGDGPWLEALREELGGIRAAFTGFIEGGELTRAIASAHLLVFPSLTDTFGNAVLEAYASGVPAVVSDRGGPAELTRHNGTGWIVPATDPATWASEITRLLSEPATLQRAGRAARELALQRPEEAYGRSLWQVYEAALENSRKGSAQEIR